MGRYFNVSGSYHAFLKGFIQIRACKFSYRTMYSVTKENEVLYNENLKMYTSQCEINKEEFEKLVAPIKKELNIK